MSAPATTYWCTPADAADQLHLSVNTVLHRLQSGELHGHQRTRRGKWLIAPAAVRAHAQELDERAQRDVCGCAHLRAIRHRT